MDASPPGETRSGRRLVPLVLCVVVFISGGLIGIGLTVIFPSMTALLQPPRPDYGSMTDEQRAERYVARLADRLDLSDEQVDKLRPIVRERMKDFMDAFDRVRPELIASLKEMDRQVRPLLNDEQQQAWREYYDERLRRYRPQEPATQP